MIQRRWQGDSEEVVGRFRGGGRVIQRRWQGDSEEVAGCIRGGDRPNQRTAEYSDTQAGSRPAYNKVEQASLTHRRVGW